MRKTMRRSEAEWHGLIKQFQDSGMTAYRWCAKEGISITTFRRKLNLLPINSAIIKKESVQEKIVDEPKEVAALPVVEKKEETINVGLIPEIGNISKACKTIYLVDTENISGEPISALLKSVDASDKLIFFYTDKSNHISYNVLGAFFEKRDLFSLIHCGCGTSNALDFQLVTVLGDLISECKHSGYTPEFAIITKDNGFDAAVKFWKSRGVKIKRITPENIQGAEKAREPVAKAADNAIPIKPAPALQVLVKPKVEPVAKQKPREDAISRYYIAHPTFQKQMKQNLACRMGSEFKKHHIEVKDKQPVMGVLLRWTSLKEADFEKICTPEAAKLIVEIPADIIKTQRDAVYQKMLKLHPESVK